MGDEMQELGKVDIPKSSTAKRREIVSLIKSQDFRCALSGKKLSPETAELDHIKPVSKGGNHTVDNLQVLHKKVNRMKGTMTNEEFVAWCSLVVDAGG